MLQSKFTEKEKIVLLYVSQGCTNKQIAAKLGITYHTVKTHVSSLLKKTNLSTRILLAKEGNNLMNKEKPVLLIGLDGVLNYYTGSIEQYYIPPIKKGAKNFIKGLTKNYVLILLTKRKTALVWKWLKENNIEDYFDDITSVIGNHRLIIDIDCICFQGNYKEVKNKIENYKTYIEE